MPRSCLVAAAVVPFRLSSESTLLKDQHVAVAIDGRGVRLDEKHVRVAICGYEDLRWSRSLGQIQRVRHRAPVPTVLGSHAS